MASFRILESGYTQAIVRRKGYPAESKTFRTKTQAETWARQVESRMDGGSFVSLALAERNTFGQVAERFASEFAPHHYRGRAWRHKLAHLVERLGEYSLAAFTPQLAAEYRDKRLKDPDPRYTRDPGTAPKVSPATVKTELDLLSKVLDVASKEFGIPLPGGNPVKSIRKPRQGRARDRRLSAEEWGALMDEVKVSRNSWLHAAVLLSVETAMRQGELLQLEWRMIDKKRRVALLLDSNKIKNGEARAVPLSGGAIAVLESLPKAIGGRVIPLEKNTLYGAFKNACVRAGIENFTWHDLRHEALTRLAERGDLSMLELAQVSGHKTLQMLKRYTHLQAENLAKKLG